MITESLEKEHFNYLNTAVIVIDDNLKVACMNNAAEFLIGLSEKQLCGIPLSTIIKNGQEMITAIESAATDKSSFTARSKELEFVTGRNVTSDYTVGFLPGEGILLELNQVDHHLRITRDEINHAQSSAMHKMVKNLAHEVRNPLGGLRGAAQLLEKELDDPDLREYTRIIISEADRLKELVSRILGDSKIAHEKIEINIHQLLERVRQLCIAEGLNGIEIKDDYDPSIPPVNAYADQLIQAILNIVRNALEALNSNGRIIFRTRVVRQVIIGNVKHKLAMKIDIQDNGPGIAEDIKENLFLPTITTKENGTGLGLSIAQSIIYQHKGIIECNEVDGETVFSIFLPLEDY
ncbi:MAG: PAS domain-containing sensor histidine kinase [Gammaproteobacteria bacterium]|nr:MAG: PAS domain-containing sensor histidine kinase [Gammaproteobacteria bacterium]